MASNSPLFQHIQALLNEGEDPGKHDQHIYRDFGKTVAVMVIDSVGFSRIARQHGIIHFLSKLIEVREIISPALLEHAAIDIRFEADNAFAAFENIENALKAANAIHRAIATAEVVLSDDEHFRVCIGIGYGELLHAGHEGYFGDQMNIASKLGEDLAKGAETLITIEAHTAADASLTEDFVEDTANIAGVELRYARKTY